MEYCSLGPLHNYIVEKRFLGPGSFGPRRPPPKRSTADEQGDGERWLQSHVHCCIIRVGARSSLTVPFFLTDDWEMIKEVWFTTSRARLSGMDLWQSCAWLH